VPVSTRGHSRYTEHNSTPPPPLSLSLPLSFILIPRYIIALEDGLSSSSIDDMDAATIQLLVTTVDAVQTSRYTSAAAVTIYLYNIFLTFDLEVR
jgi:hypothetical protein